MAKSTLSGSTEQSETPGGHANRGGWVSTLLLVAVGLGVGFALMNFVALPRLPGSAQADVDEATLCVELASNFTDYPLLYAGPEVQGHALRGCRHNKTADRFAEDGTRFHAATDSFTFAYGTCVISKTASSCPIPAAIIVYPSCEPVVSVGTLEGGLVVRGLPAGVKEDGSLEIKAPGYRLEIYAPGSNAEQQRDNAIVVVDALVPANDMAVALGPDAPLSTALEAPRGCP